MPADERGVSVGLRVPGELLRRIEAERRRIATETGIAPSRSQVLLALVRQALDARDKK